LNETPKHLPTCGPPHVPPGPAAGQVQVVFSNGAGDAILCEPAPAQVRRPQETKSDTRRSTPSVATLTRRRRRLIAPVVGRSGEIEQTVRDPRAPAQEQRRPDREAGVRQDRDRRRPRAAESTRATSPHTPVRRPAVALDRPAWILLRARIFRGQFENRFQGRARGGRLPRGQIVLFSTSCTPCSLPATPMARWTPPTCSSRARPRRAASGSSPPAGLVTALSMATPPPPTPSPPSLASGASRAAPSRAFGRVHVAICAACACAYETHHGSSSTTGLDARARLSTATSPIPPA